MPHGRLHPQTQWKALGAAIAHKGGDRAALARIMTGRVSVDRWINDGYEVTARRLALRAVRRQDAAQAAIARG